MLEARSLIFGYGVQALEQILLGRILQVGYGIEVFAGWMWWNLLRKLESDLNVLSKSFLDRVLDVIQRGLLDGTTLDNSYGDQIKGLLHDLELLDIGDVEQTSESAPDNPTIS